MGQFAKSLNNNLRTIRSSESAFPIVKRSVSSPVQLRRINYDFLRAENIPAAVRIHHVNRKDEYLTRKFGSYVHCAKTEESIFGKLFESIIERDTSIGAFDAETRELAGCMFNFMLEKPEGDKKNWLSDVIDSTIRDAQTLELFKYLDKIEHKFDLFEYFNARKAQNQFFVGVNPKYRQYGLGFGLMRMALKVGDKMNAENHPNAPQFAFGITTSPYSLKIATQLGFKAVYSERYKEEKRKSQVENSESKMQQTDEIYLVARQFTGKDFEDNDSFNQESAQILLQ